MEWHSKQTKGINSIDSACSFQGERSISRVQIQEVWGGSNKTGAATAATMNRNKTKQRDLFEATDPEQNEGQPQ